MRILFLEDVGRVSYYIKQQLEKAGHEVDMAFNISRANGYLDEKAQEKVQYDCLIVDLNMPTNGLKEEEIKNTHNGLFTGWIWLHDVVFKSNPDYHERTIIFSAYLNEFRERMPSEEIKGIIMIPKRDTTDTDKQLQDSKLLSAIKGIEKKIKKLKYKARENDAPVK